ncbi:hypothetical protein [Thermococcus sp.]
MKRIAAFVMIFTLLASVGSVAGGSVPLNDTSAKGGNIGVHNETARVVGLLKVVDRLSNYTQALINGSANVSNETLVMYQKANELRKRAWEAYNAGNYSIAAGYAISAMRLYKRVIMTLNKERREEIEVAGGELQGKWKLRNMARIQLQMAVQELRYAEIIMRRMNVTPEFVEAYKQTKEMVEKVRQDLVSGNFTLLREDLPKLIQARTELHRQILLSTSREFKVRAFKAVRKQIRIFDVLLPKLLVMNVTLNGTLSDDIRELMSIREELQKAMKEGNVDKVVELLKELHEKLREIKRKIRMERKLGVLPKRPVVPGSSTGHESGHEGRHGQGRP